MSGGPRNSEVIRLADGTTFLIPEGAVAAANRVDNQVVIAAAGPEVTEAPSSEPENELKSFDLTEAELRWRASLAEPARFAPTELPGGDLVIVAASFDDNCDG